MNLDYSRWDEVKQSWPLRYFLREHLPSYYMNHDLRKGIPFADSTAHAVYAAQFLEHLDKDAAIPFLREVFRVLKPGGTIRLAVPDLEHIARYYLETVAGVREGVPHASERHEWATIWLFDQMVRTKISGEMGEWVTRNRTSPVLKEIGGEIEAGSVDSVVTSDGQAPVQPVMTFRNRLAYWLRRCYTPHTAAETGELHRWMYDEISLKAVLKMAGFREVVRCSHAESRIDDWNSYGFDEFPDGSPTQPGSLWMEAIK